MNSRLRTIDRLAIAAATFMVAIAAIFSLTPGIANQKKEDHRPRPLGVLRTNRPVFRRDRGASQWEKVMEGTPIYLGDTVYTPQATSSAIDMSAGKTFPLEPASMVRLDAFDKQTIDVTLFQGATRYGKVHPLPPVTFAAITVEDPVIEPVEPPPPPSRSRRKKARPAPAETEVDDTDEVAE